MIGVFVAYPGIDTVGGENQVRVWIQVIQRLDLALKFHLDADFLATFLQYQQQILARHAAKTIACNRDFRPLEIGDDIVPVGERFTDPVIRHLVVVAEMTKRFGREHDTEAERVV